MTDFSKQESFSLKVLNKCEPVEKSKNDGNYMFLYVINGKSSFSINGKVIYAGEYDYFVVRNKDSFILKTVEHESSVLVFSVPENEIQFITDYYGEKLKKRMEAESVLFVSGDYNAKFRTDEMVERVLRLGDADNVISRQLASEFISGIVGKLHRREKTDEIPEFLIEAMKTLRDPENLRLGVAAIEKYTHYSRAQICRLVKKYYKVTPQEYVTNLRLSFAYNMIIYTTNSINLIAAEVGYQSLSAFYSQFKDKYHVLPSELRKTKKFKQHKPKQNQTTN